MEIIAHRGASHDAPENTLAAVYLAWQQNADALEVDVRLSKDGRLVISHDDCIKRAGKTAKKISEQTLAQLRLLDVGRWKGEQWCGERIPTLEEVLATVPEGKRLFVELKCGPESVSEFARIARNPANLSMRIVAIGFSLQTMAQLKGEMPELEVCWICKFRRNLRTRRWTPTAEELIAAATGAGLDGVDLDARGPVDSPLVRKLKGAGLRVYVWTVDLPATAGKLVAAGVDGITTNRPGWLKEKLGSAGETR